MTVLRTLSDFAAMPVRADARMRRFVRFSVFDWLGVGRAGVAEPVSDAVRGLAGGQGATLFGGGRATPRRSRRIQNPAGKKGPPRRVSAAVRGPTRRPATRR